LEVLPGLVVEAGVFGLLAFEAGLEGGGFGVVAGGEVLDLFFEPGVGGGGGLGVGVFGLPGSVLEGGVGGGEGGLGLLVGLGEGGGVAVADGADLLVAFEVGGVAIGLDAFEGEAVDGLDEGAGVFEVLAEGGECGADAAVADGFEVDGAGAGEEETDTGADTGAEGVEGEGEGGGLAEDSEGGDEGGTDEVGGDADEDLGEFDVLEGGLVLVGVLEGGVEGGAGVTFVDVVREGLRRGWGIEDEVLLVVDGEGLDGLVLALLEVGGGLLEGFVGFFGVFLGGGFDTFEERVGEPLGFLDVLLDLGDLLVAGALGEEDGSGVGVLGGLEGGVALGVGVGEAAGVLGGDLLAEFAVAFLGVVAVAVGVLEDGVLAVGVVEFGVGFGGGHFAGEGAEGLEGVAEEVAGVEVVGGLGGGDVGGGHLGGL
jgi:hypothetical protein